MEIRSNVRFMLVLSPVMRVIAGSRSYEVTEKRHARRVLAVSDQSDEQV